MSIYKKVLGEEFTRLHPMLQKRYAFPDNEPFYSTGTMRTIKIGAKLPYRFFLFGIKKKLLFPEHGTNIYFTILNTPKVGANGEEQIHWERTFYFGRKKRYFNALMSFDSKRNIIKDYLGEPSVLYSDLIFTVASDGSLKIESSKQRLILGKVEIPLPRLFKGIATVTEEFNEEKNVFEIAVDVRNPLIGPIFSYEGEFNVRD